MSNREATKKLLELLAEYKKTILLIVSCLLVSTGLNLCIPLLSRNIMDMGFIGQDQPLLIKLVILSAIIYLLNSCLNLIKEKKRTDISAQLEYTLSKRAFQHLMKLHTEYFNKKNYAELLNNMNTDIGNMVSITDEGMFFLVTQIFSITGGLIGLLIINDKLTLLVLLFIPCKYLFIKYIAKKRKKYMNEYIIEAEDYARWFGDTVGGIQEVKLFNILDFKNQEFDTKQKKVISKKKKMNILGVWNITIDMLLVQFLVMVLYIVGANWVFDLQLSIGSVFAFITYSTYVTSPISGILNIGYMLSGIIPSTKRFYEFMDLQEEDGSQDRSSSAKYGVLELKNINFSYENSKTLLENVTLRFEKGSKTALIGKNGSGKSTIIGLITRMYQPNQGKVLLNEVDIATIPLNEYRSMISVVSQQIYLFNDTIYNNICLYKKITEEEVWQALADSGLKEFVEEVTLNYLVGQNGSLLSGGQKQKMALARAFIHNKSIIIFDEPTSNTDVYSENQIHSQFSSRLKEKTVILVTHKQEVLKDMDCVMFLCEDGIVSGTYEKLYLHCSGFRDMLSLGDNK